MALQNFVDKIGPAVSAAWLNGVDTFWQTAFGGITTQAQAQALIAQSIYLQTAAETAAIAQLGYGAVLQGNYPPGDLRRYQLNFGFNVDITQTLNLACLAMSLQGGGDVWVDGSISGVINTGNVSVGNNVTIKGPHSRPGLFQPYTTAGLQALGGAIWINPAFSIQLAPGTGTGTSVAGNAGIMGLYIICKGIVVPTSAGQATTVVAGFSGTAIVIAGTTTVGDLTGIDCYMGHLQILGFAQAISGAISDRTVIEYVSGDNTAGIYLNHTNDLARIHHCHFWPFLTYFFLAQSWRTGSGFFFDTLAQGCSIEDCFSYGYTIGFNVQGASCVLTNCWADAAQSVNQANSMSFNLVGNDIKVIGGQASSHQYGYYVNSGGNVDMQSCSSWGSPSNQQYGIYVNAVNLLRIQGGSLWGSTGTVPSIAFIGMNTVNIVGWSIDGVSFWDQSVANTAVSSIPGATALIGNFGVNCNYKGVNPPAQTQDARQFGQQPPVHARYFVGATAQGLVDDFLQARGTLANATASQAGDVIYKLNAFGATTTPALQPAASMRFQVQLAPGANSMPGCVIWSTTPNGSIVPVDRMILTNAGNLDPVTDASFSLGEATLRWRANFTAFVNDANGLGFFTVTAGQAQPTTAGAAAAFVQNAGNAVNDASTFDGYTLKQVVKALRTLGLLA